MKKNSGFTLMEVMVVVGIIGIMSAIAIPNYISYLPKHRISGASRGIYSAMQYARIRAVKERTPVAIRFSTGVGLAGGYTVFTDDVTTNGILDAGETQLKTGTMPVDVNMSIATFAGGALWTSFDSKGLPVGTGGVVGDGYVDIQNAPRNLYRRIVLRVTGSPDIRISLDGGATYPDT